MKCEMCGAINKTVHEGQCLNCHVEICDMPLSECIGKQTIFKRLGYFDRLAYFDDSEIQEYLTLRRVQ